jgi:hypothetical protein
LNLNLEFKGSEYLNLNFEPLEFKIFKHSDPLNLNRLSLWPGQGASTLDYIHRQSAARRFLVLGLHVGAGLPHGLDDLVE